jgi:hypothetical protein
MNPNLIYVKTASGENAIQRRTRAIPRNARVVLILVDGYSSVADLIRKTGNLQTTENALAELERAGFIERKDHPPSTESQQVAQEIRASAIEKAVHSSRTENRGSKAPSHPAFGAGDEIEEEEVLASRFSSLPTGLDLLEKPDKRQKPEKRDRSMISKPSIAAQLKSMWIRADRLLDDRPVRSKPVRRRAWGSRGTSWLAVFVFGFLGLLALGVVTVLVFPFNIYVSDLEKAFSAAVARPVGVQEMHVKLYPEPALVLENVQLGQGDDRIRIREIRLHPDFESLFSERSGLRKVVASGTELPLERITGMPAIFAALARPEGAPRIRFILLKNTDISFHGIVLKNADAEIRRDSAGNMRALAARSADGSVLLEARPAAAAIDLAVEAYGFGPDADSRFVSDSLSFKGRLERDTLVISDLEIRALDGLIQGDALVRAGGAKPNLSGTIVFERINASRLGDALGIGRKLDGILMGNMRFSTSSEKWPTLFSSIEGEGDFTMQRGSLNGFDLAETARRVSGMPVQGGVTNFERMSGKVRLSQEKSRFHDLNLSSGLMQSTGYLDVDGNGQLSGQLELQMKGSVNQTRMSVMISGTLSAPTLRAGR